MLNIKHIIANPKEVEEKLRKKDPSVTLAPLISAYKEFAETKSLYDMKKAEANSAAKEIGEAVQKKLDPSPIKARMGALKPEKGPHFLNHLEMGAKHDLFSLEMGARITGSGWPVYKNMYPRIELALIQLMINTHGKNGFEVISTPYVVSEETMYGSGQLPKFKEQVYKLDEEHPLYLIPTSEVSLNGIYQDTIFRNEELPKFMTTFSPCFRREAGSHGKNERGLIRIHQFHKVELFAITTPDKSNDAFEKILASAEEVLQTLGLHYRNMLLVTGDMSFASSKTVDIEVWLPGQDRYYEVSSISNCTDFQARRSKIRYKRENIVEPVHTLNGSGLALPRLMVALLENFQDSEGNFTPPACLHPFL